MASKQFSLNKADWHSQLRSALIFLAPLALIYLAQVNGTLQMEHHVVSLEDFKPTSFTLGAISLYVVNQVTGMIRKFMDGK